MAIQQVPLAGATFLAALDKAALAASKLHLFTTNYTPTPNDTLTALEAIEATFSGYTAGGYALSAFTGPFYGNNGGVIIISPQISVAFITPGEGDPVDNVVTGWFLVDSTGNLVADGAFTQTQPLQNPGDGFPITIALVVGSNAQQAQCWVDGVQQ